MTNERIIRSRRNVLLGAAAATLLRNVKIPLEISPEVSGMAAQTIPTKLPLFVDSHEILSKVTDAVWPDEEIGFVPVRFFTSERQINKSITERWDRAADILRLDDFVPHHCFMETYVDDVMFRLRIHPRDWDELKETIDFQDHFSVGFSSQSSEERKILQDLNNPQHIRRSLYENLSYTDRWIDKWSKRLEEIARGLYIRALKKFDAPRIVGATAEEIADAIRAKELDRHCKSAIWRTYQTKLKTKELLGQGELDHYEIHYRSSVEMALLGERFRQRVNLDKGTTPTFPGWSHWDETMKANYLFEMVFFLKNSYVAGALIKDPEILAYMIKDAGYDRELFIKENSRQALESNDSHLARLWSNEFDNGLHKEGSSPPTSLSIDLFEAQIYSRASQILPYTWKEAIDLHVAIADVLKEQLLTKELARGIDNLGDVIQRLGMWNKGEMMLSFVLPRNVELAEKFEQFTRVAFKEWQLNSEIDDASALLRIQDNTLQIVTSDGLLTSRVYDEFVMRGSSQGQRSDLRQLTSKPILDEKRLG